jgi:hypothetical protein
MNFVANRIGLALFWSRAARDWRSGWLERTPAVADRAEEAGVPMHARPEPRDRADELCRQYLRLKYGEQSSATEAFINQMERSESVKGNSRWSRLIDTHDAADDILAPLDRAFREWSGK